MLLEKDIDMVLQEHIEQLINELCIQIKNNQRPLIVYPQLDMLSLMNDFPIMVQSMYDNFEDFIELMQKIFVYKLSEFMIQDKPIEVDSNDLILCPCLTTCPAFCRTQSEILVSNAYDGKLMDIENMYVQDIKSSYYMLYYREYYRDCSCQLMKPKVEAITYNNIFTLFRKSIYSSFNQIGQECSGVQKHCIECHKNLIPDCSKDRFVNCMKLICTAFQGNKISVWVLGDILKYTRIEKGSIINGRGMLIKRPKAVNSKGIVQQDLVFILMGCSNVCSLPNLWKIREMNAYSNYTLSSQIIKQKNLDYSLSKLKIRSSKKDYRDYIQHYFSKIDECWKSEIKYCSKPMPDCPGLCYSLLLSASSVLYNDTKDFYYNHLNIADPMTPIHSQLNSSFSIPTDTKQYKINKNDLEAISVLMLCKFSLSIYISLLQKLVKYRIITLNNMMPANEIIELSKRERCIFYVPHITMMKKQQLNAIEEIISNKICPVWCVLNKEEFKPRIKPTKKDAFTRRLFSLFTLAIDLNNISTDSKQISSGDYQKRLEFQDGTQLLTDYISIKLRNPASISDSKQVVSFAIAHTAFEYFQSSLSFSPECIPAISVYDALVAIIMTEEKSRALHEGEPNSSVLFNVIGGQTTPPKSKSMNSKSIVFSQFDRKLEALCEFIINMDDKK